MIAPEGTSLTGIDWNWGDGTTEIGCYYFIQSHTYARSGQYTVVVTTTFTAVLVHAPETPETHKPTATKGNSSGRLIHAASGSCGALGGFLKRPGWAR